MSDALQAQAAAGTEAYIAALGIAGASQAAAQLVTLPMTRQGVVSNYAKPSGTLFTRTEILAGNGHFVSTSPSATIWTVPTLAQLGWTWSFGVSLVIPMQRGGLGPLQVNSASYRGTLSSQSAMLAVLGAFTGDYVIRSDDSNKVYILTGSTVAGGQYASTLANWTAQPLGGGNLPTAAGVVLNDPQGFAPQSTPVYGYSTLKLMGTDVWCFI